MFVGEIITQNILLKVRKFQKQIILFSILPVLWLLKSSLIYTWFMLIFVRLKNAQAKEWV